MTKVCHMTSAHEPEDIRIFHKECISLAKAGYDVYLVERGNSYDKNGVHIVGVENMPDRRLKRMTIGAKRVYQKALEIDADIYHFHDPELLPYAMKLKKKGKKVIFDSHENYTDQISSKPYLPDWLARILSRIYGRYEKHVLRNIDGLIHTCVKFGVDQYLGQCKNIEIVYNLPSLNELYNRYDPSIVKKWDICYVGGLTASRGITNLVLAACKANCTIALAGQFSPIEYKKEIESMPEFKSVSFLGKLDRDGILDVLQKCRIGMSTLLNVGQYNQDDSLPTKVYEYMALAIPVIISKSPYNVRNVERYQFGICVDPDSTEEISLAIRYLLDHVEDAKRMGENGRKAIKKYFNWESEEKKLLKLYKKILPN